MASDRYDRMTTAELEAEAGQRGVDLSDAANNAERADRIRQYDAQVDTQTQADAQTALDNAAALNDQGQGETRTAAEAQAQADAEAPGNAAQEARNQAAARGDRGAPGPFDVAPYPSEQDAQNRVDAASGNLSTEQSINPDDAEPVGGDPGYVADDRDEG